MSADESAVDERKKAARSHVRALFERLSLTTSSKSISNFSVKDLLDTAVRYKAPADMMSTLEKLTDEQLCWHVQKNFFHNRNAAVAAFQLADNFLSLSSYTGVAQLEGFNFGKCVRWNLRRDQCSRALVGWNLGGWL